jgi:tetratricopeptide (TPR) repeat protein
MKLLDTAFQSKKGPKNLDKDLNKYLYSHPDFFRKAPIILERGDHSGQDLILILAEKLRIPELLAAIKDFALSQNGPDQLRYRAAILAAQENLIAKQVTLWLQGEWKEIRLMAYEFHSEPTIQHSKRVGELLTEAIYLLQERHKDAAREAETLLRQALEIEPDTPDLLNNLSKALEIQGNAAAARELREDIVKRFPDYLFTRVSKAHEHLIQGDLDAAEALLLPILERERFHFLEFGAFSDVYLSLLTAQKDWEKAKNWFEIWEQVDPDNPRLDYWQDEFDNHIWLSKT